MAPSFGAARAATDDYKTPEIMAEGC